MPNYGTTQHAPLYCVTTFDRIVLLAKWYTPFCDNLSSISYWVTAQGQNCRQESAR